MGHVRSVVLFSGGIDSSVVVALEREAGNEVHALTIDYGQTHIVEVAAAAHLAPVLGVASHTFAKISGSVFGRQGVAGGDVSGTAYVPARNTVFLSLALALAESTGARRICIGAHADDVRDYPDCRPEFFESFSAMSAVASPLGVQISVVAPLASMKKTDVVIELFRLQLPIEKMVTCYRGLSCGECNACSLRIAAVDEALITIGSLITGPLPPDGGAA